MPKGPRKLTIAFGTQSLTHYGGVYLPHRFFTRIGFKNAIPTDVRLNKRLCLPQEFQTSTLQTLRHRILLMPAQLLRTDNRPRLATPTSGPREAAWKYAMQKIERLNL